jgi:iron complex outermembrane receptor protein
VIGLCLLLFLAILPDPARAGAAGGERTSPLVPRDSAVVSAAAIPDRFAAGADSTAARGGTQEPAAVPQPVRTFPEVRIERARILSDARRRVPTAFVTDLRVGASGRALETLSETLGQAAGVRIVQYGGLGAFSTVSLRGSPPGQVAIYLDGVPLTSAAHGVVSLADLPVTAVDRVEVYRGISPLSLGVATPGGAINLITVSAPELREARVVRGSFGTWEARGTAGARHAGVAALLHAGYQGSGGDFPFLDDNGTGAEPSDDRMSRRANNRFDAATALATLEFAARGGVRARLREDVFHKHQGVPGLGVNQALHTRLSFLRSISTLALERRAGRLWPEVRALGAVQRERSRFRDLELELGLGRHDTDDRIGGENLSLGIEWPRLPLGLSIQAGGLLRRERADLTDAADGEPDPPESRRTVTGADAGIQLRPFGEWLTLHAARRWDRIRDRLRTAGVTGSAPRPDLTRALDSPQLGACIAGPRGFELRANWARAQRPPDFLELFGNQGSVLGNPLLLPEQGENWDAGAAWAGTLAPGVRGAAECAYFESHARDLIAYVRNSASSVKALNISRARIRGEELSARMSARAGVSLSAALSWQSGVDQGAATAYRGKRLPQRSGRQAYACLDWTTGRLRATADLHYIGDNALDRYNLYWAASRTLVGASVSTLIHRGGLRLVLEGKNLGDGRATDVGGFPLPGRSVFVSCQARLGAPVSGLH